MVAYSFTLRLQPQQYAKDIDGVAAANTLRCWPEIKQSYFALKNLSKLTNDLVGIRLSVFLIKAILYYAIILDRMSEWIHVIQVAEYVYVSAMFFAISADSAFQVYTNIQQGITLMVGVLN